MYENQRRFDAAIEWYQLALEGYRVNVGERYPGTSKVRENLRELYETLGRHDEAAALREPDSDILSRPPQPDIEPGLSPDDGRRNDTPADGKAGETNPPSEPSGAR